ncbi:MAG TPA: hypothetical protein VFA89_15500 [Terriglobales bacterium]|nr:hypothetical protein [Terriglobales bacterium]
MSQDRKPIRTWQEIAAEVAKETDPKKLIELAEELNRALEMRDPILQMKKSA